MLSDMKCIAKLMMMGFLVSLVVYLAFLKTSTYKNVPMRWLKVKFA